MRPNFGFPIGRPDFDPFFRTTASAAFVLAEIKSASNAVSFPYSVRLDRSVGLSRVGGLGLRLRSLQSTRAER